MDVSGGGRSHERSVASLVYWSARARDTEWLR